MVTLASTICCKVFVSIKNAHRGNIENRIRRNGINVEKSEKDVTVTPEKAFFSRMGKAMAAFEDSKEESRLAIEGTKSFF